MARCCAQTPLRAAEGSGGERACCFSFLSAISCLTCSAGACCLLPGLLWSLLQAASASTPVQLGQSP